MCTRVRIAFITVLVASVLVGCGPLARPTPTPEPVQISFVYSSEVMTPHYERLESDFESENPHIDVVLHVGNPYNALGATSQRADVAEIDQLGLAILAESGMIRSIEPLLASSPQLDLDDFYEGTFDSMRWHGELWGLPTDVDPWVFYFNKDLFDRAGVPYPTAQWTWDDMLNAAQRIADPTLDPPIYGIITDMNRADFLPLIYQNGGSVVDSLLEPKKFTFTDPATIEAVEWYVSLSLSYGVAPTPRELTRIGGFNRAILDQRGAMWYGSMSENGNTWGVEWPFEWGVVPPPRNKQRMALLTLHACVLSSASQHPKLAWEWMTFVTMHPATSRGVPPLKTVAQSDAFRASHRPDVAQAALETMAIGRTIPATTWIDDVGNWLMQALTSVYEEQASVADALELVQGDAERLLDGQGSQ